MGTTAGNAVKSGRHTRGTSRQRDGTALADLAAMAAAHLLTGGDAVRGIRVVLQQVTTILGADCAVALRPATAAPLAWNQAYHGSSAAEASLVAAIRAQCAVRGSVSGPQASFHADIGSGRTRRPLAVAYAAPIAGQRLCALAVVGGQAAPLADATAVLTACATMMASRLGQLQPGQAGDRLDSALVAAAPDAVVAVDEAGRICEFNQAAEVLFGRSRAEALGKDMPALLIPERHRPIFREGMAAYVATGDTSAFGSRLRLQGMRADGSEPLITFTPLALNVGSATFFCAFAHNVRDLPQAEAKELETDVRFGLLSELAPVGIVQADIDGQTTFVNGRWCKLTGLSDREALGRPWLSSVHPDDAPQVRARLATTTAAGSELRIDFRLRTVPGTDIWVHGAVRPLIDAGGSCTGHLVAVTNVDERKQAETERELARRQLATQNARLRDLDLAKTQFLGTVSHELRSPLTSIVSFAQLMKEDQRGFPEQADEYIEIIQRNAERLLRLVSDLLELDHLDEGGVALEMAPVVIPDVVSDAVRASSASVARAGLELRVSQGDGPAIEADRIRLQQILDNLISNAIKFSQPGGHIEVRSSCDDRDWEISVSDSGIGIPAAEISQLFERFFRASNAIGSQVPGTGLGLATAKAIAELHGGTVEASSVQGSSTTIVVRLPLRR